MDPKLYRKNISEVINNIEEGNLSGAFDSLDINGVGHKIRSFFIRDMIVLTKCEGRIKETVENYLYAFPIDIWLSFVSNSINYTPTSSINTERRSYRINKNALSQATKLIELSLKAHVSPLRVNQGAWYFASRVVAERRRLEQLLTQEDTSVLDKEVSLVGDILSMK